MDTGRLVSSGNPQSSIVLEQFPPLRLGSGLQGCRCWEILQSMEGCSCCMFTQNRAFRRKQAGHAWRSHFPTSVMTAYRTGNCSGTNTVHSLSSFFFNSLNSSSTSLLCCSSSCLIDASPSFSPLISERKQFYRHVFQKIFLHAAQACWLTVTRTPVSPRVASSLPVVGVHCGFHPPGSSRTRWYDRASRTKGRESECLLAFLWWLHGVLFLI